MLRGNFRQVSDHIEKFSRQLKSALMNAAAEIIDQIGIASQSRYWITPGGPNKNTDPGKLTVRSGRLIRSLSPQGGAFHAGEREQIREIKVSGRKIIGIFGTRVPYAAIHEYGGTLPAMTIYPQKARALHFFTKDGREVFAKRANLPPRTIPARPFLGPAAREVEPKVVGIIDGKIAKIM